MLRGMQLNNKLTFFKIFGSKVFKEGEAPTNEFGYVGGNDTNGRMFVFENAMVQYDLNSQALQRFAFYLEKDNLQAIKKLFDKVTNQQKEGLLVTFLDYFDLDLSSSIYARMGDPIKLAEKFGSQELADYLKQELQQIKDAENTKVLVK